MPARIFKIVCIDPQRNFEAGLASVQHLMRICLTFPSIRMNSYGCGAVLDEEICNKSQSVMAYIITCIFSYTVFTLPYLLKYAAGKRFVYCGKKLYNFYIALSPSVQKLLNKIFLKFECLSTILKMLLYRQTAKGESDSGRKNIQLRPPSPELHNQNNFVPFISCLPKLFKLNECEENI